MSPKLDTLLLLKETCGSSTLVRDKLLKIHFPSKGKLFMWLIIHEKVSIWDNIQLRNFRGLGRCNLYKLDIESSKCIFLKCNFIIDVQCEIYGSTGTNHRWLWDAIDEGPKCQMNSQQNKKFKFVPLTIRWGIFLARNKELFKDKSISSSQCSLQILATLYLLISNSSKASLIST